MHVCSCMHMCMHMHICIADLPHLGVFVADIASAAEMVVLEQVIFAIVVILLLCSDCANENAINGEQVLFK